MSNLIPEPRVNKHGVSVIKHVRAEAKSKHTSFLAQVVPALNGNLKKQRESMLADLHRDMELEFQQEADAAKRRYDDRNRFPELERSYAEQMYQRERMEQTRLRVTRDLDRAMGKEETHVAGLNKLSTKTLGMVHAAFHGTGKVTAFLKRQDFDDDDRIRTAVVFRDFSDSYQFGRLLRHVRDSLGVKSLAGIEEGTLEHNAVSAVFRVAIGAAQRRSIAEREERLQDKSQAAMLLSQRKMRNQVLDEQDRVKMSPQLAEIAADNPDRVDDIVDYLVRQNVEPVDVDAEHLQLFLDNPSPALADGIL